MTSPTSSEYANTVFAPPTTTTPAERRLRELLNNADIAIAQALEQEGSSRSAVHHLLSNVHDYATSNIVPRNNTPIVSQPLQDAADNADAAIADMLRRLSLDPAAEPAPEYAEGGVEVQRSNSGLGGNGNGARMEEGTADSGEEALGSDQRTTHTGRSSPNDLSLTHAQGLCDQCHGPLEYCHGHSSPEPLTIRPRESPRGSNASISPPRRMVNIDLNREEALALADELAAAVRQDDENSAEVPPPYPTEGMEVRGRGRRGRGRGGQRGRGRPFPLPANERPDPIPFLLVQEPRRDPPLQRARDASPPLYQDQSQPPQGYEHNRGAVYIPFNIIDQYGREVPARYIQVHMNDDNPYAIGRMTANGASYHGEIHAAPSSIPITPPNL